MFGVDFVDLLSSLVFLDYRRPFNICCKASLVVLNSLNFCLSEKLLISPSILNEILAGYSNLGCRFFPFSTLNISCHSLLACRVSAENLAVKHMGFPLYVICCFSLAAFNILSLCLVFVSLISHPTPVLLPGKSHGQRSLVGCRPWGHEKSETTERLHFHFLLSCIGEGNGNPLQCSCLEDPRDRRAWWAAVYGVTQSQTRLK